MDQSNFLSVVIPVHNQAAALERCLTSIYQSQDKSFDVIVVDDCSSDGSPEVAQRYPCRVLRLTERRYPSGARNEGAQVAQGQIILFLDSDVLVRPDTISRVVDTFKKQAEVSCLTGVYAEFHPNGELWSQYQNLFLRKRFLAMREHVPTPTSAVLAVRKEVFERNGGFNSRLPTYEDFELGHRLHEDRVPVYLDKKLEVVHLKRFSILGLMRDYWRKVSNMVFYGLENKRWLLKALGAERTGFMTAQRMGMAASSGLVLLLPAIFLMQEPALGLAAIALCACSVLGFLPFGLYLGQVRGPLFSLLAFGVNVLVWLTITAAAATTTFQYYVLHRRLPP